VSQALVLVLNNNLFFRFPIEDALARQGRRGAFAQTDARFAEALGAERPDLAIIDLETRGADWAACVRQAAEAGVPVIAFGPHDDLEARATALAAGARAVYAKSKFHADLPALLDRHIAHVAP